MKGAEPPEHLKLTSAQVVKNITDRHDRAAGQAVLARREFLLIEAESANVDDKRMVPVYTMSLKLGSQVRCYRVVVMETHLRLYREWLEAGAQRAVNEAFRLLVVSKTTSPWMHAVAQTQCEAAIMWLELNASEIQSSTMSWPEALTFLS